MNPVELPARQAKLTVAPRSLAYLQNSQGREQAHKAEFGMLQNVPVFVCRSFRQHDVIYNEIVSLRSKSGDRMTHPAHSPRHDWPDLDNHRGHPLLLHGLKDHTVWMAEHTPW